MDTGQKIHIRTLYQVPPFLSKLTIDELINIYRADYHYLKNSNNPLKDEIEYRLKYINNKYIDRFFESEYSYHLSLIVTHNSKYAPDTLPVVYKLFTKCMQDIKQKNIYIVQTSKTCSNTYVQLDIPIDTLPNIDITKVYDMLSKNNVCEHKIFIVCKQRWDRQVLTGGTTYIKELEKDVYYSDEDNHSSIISVIYRMMNKKLIIHIKFKLDKRDLYSQLDGCDLQEFTLLKHGIVGESEYSRYRKKNTINK